MEQILLGTFYKHIRDKKVVENSQHAFLKWKIILNQYDNPLWWGDKLACGDLTLVYLDFSRVINSISYIFRDN